MILEKFECSTFSEYYINKQELAFFVVYLIFIMSLSEFHLTLTFLVSKNQLFFFYIIRRSKLTNMDEQKK